MNELCQNCGSVESKRVYRAFGVAKHVRMERSGTRFKYQLNFYKSILVGGSTLFIRDKPNPPQPLEPDAVAIFGDAHLYWLRPGEATVHVCSRACASQHADTNSLYLLDPSNLSFIAPGQKTFDEYARKNGLKDSLAQIEADESADPLGELRALLRTHPSTPDRIGRLACEAAATGSTELARTAISKLLDIFPLAEVIGVASNILARLPDLNLIDELHERLSSERGGQHKLSPQFLSGWAFLIHGHDIEKALGLSLSAVNRQPSSSMIVENHLSLLSMTKPEQGLEFYRSHKDRLKTDVGWFAAGKCLLRAGRLNEAYDCLILAEKIGPDALNKTFLAETLFRLNRHSEVSKVCDDARKQIEDYKTQVTDIGSPISHYTYDQKQILRKGLLVIEGKSRVLDGQPEFGKRLLRDAIDIRTEFIPDEPFFQDVASFSEGYLVRSDLEADLAMVKKSALEAATRALDAEDISDKLRTLLSSIETAMPKWSEAIEGAHEAIRADGGSELFEQSLNSLVDLIRNSDQISYAEHSKSTTERYEAFPTEALQALANAAFLLDEHRSEEVPLFAPVILEFAKALEVVLNRCLIQPFALWLMNSQEPNVRDLRIKLGREGRDAVLVQYGKHRGLTLGELSLLIGGSDTRWTSFLREEVDGHRFYITKTLPSVIDKVTAKRNGLAHNTSATRSQALELQALLKTDRAFDRLNEIAHLTKQRTLPDHQTWRLC